MDKPKPTRRRLTAQQLEVLTLAVAGHTIEEIARRLRISERQAKALFDEGIAWMIRAPASGADDADKIEGDEQPRPSGQDPESHGEND
jgi:hypothetical protein